MMNDFAAAKDAYESADDAWALVKPTRRTPPALAAHHCTMEPLAAACRDAATTERDRCLWDIVWHAHFVNTGQVAPMAMPKPALARPEQLSMFG